MRTKSPHGDCMAVIGSITQAMRAQKALTNAAIYSRVEKADSTQTPRGCAYGVVFSCAQEMAAERALRAAGIRVRARGRE